MDLTSRPTPSGTPPVTPPATGAASRDNAPTTGLLTITPGGTPGTPGSAVQQGGAVVVGLVSSSLAVAGGALTWAAFPGAGGASGWWPGAVLGVAALALATRGRRARSGLGLGLLFGLVFLVPHLSWSGTYVGLLPWLALATVSAVFYAALGAVMPALQRLPAGWAVAAVTGGWVAVEAARSRVPFGGFPWARLAFSQADSPAAGWAAVGGAPMVTAAVAAAGALLAAGVVAAAHLLTTGGSARHTSRSAAQGRTRGTDGQGVTRGRAVVPPGFSPRVWPGFLPRVWPGFLPRVWPVVLPVAAAVAVAGAGGVVPRPVAPQAGTVQVAAVQGNTPRPGLDFNAERRAVLDNHVQATLTLAQQVETGEAARPDLVLWPENSSDIDPYLDDQARRSIESASRALDVPLLIGAVLDGPGRYLSNTGLVVTPQEGLDGARADPDRSYVKRRPAPFGEYIPYRDFFRLFSDKVDLVERDFRPGREGGSVTMGSVRVGDVICFEVAFDDLVRDSVRSGAQMIVVQTNNATFGYSDEAVQQLAMSRLRAIETGRTVVQISTVGVSSIIAPDGDAPVRTDLFTQDVLQGQVPLRTTQTLATRLGPVPEALLSAGAVAPVLFAARLRRRRRGQAPEPGAKSVPGAEAVPAR